MTAPRKNKYSVRLKASAKKQLASLPDKALIAVSAALKRLEDDPFPHGYKALKGHSKKYRIRVGNYRILYELHGNELIVFVFEIADRKEAYD